MSPDHAHAYNYVINVGICRIDTDVLDYVQNTQVYVKKKRIFPYLPIPNLFIMRPGSKD
jgi:hypothetical protein